MLVDTLLKVLGYRGSLRAALIRRLVKRASFIPYPVRLSIDAVRRPNYGYCIFHAASLAKSLGLKRMSVLEFGVAAGNGLVDAEFHAAETMKYLGIEIEIYGFDTGSGLPEPIDYRDLPYHWRASYKMDKVKLLQCLRFAKLVIGPLVETVPMFNQTYDPAPVGVVFIDVDFYSSTVDALSLFDHGRSNFLPRAFMYLDDVIGDESELHSSFTGERLAVAEFNDAHTEQKISEAVHLKRANFLGAWRDQIFIYHDFSHAQYCQLIESNNASADRLSLVN